MRVILLVLFILLIAEIIVLFFYHDQRLVKYNDSSFVSDLRYKLFETNNTNSSYEIIYPEFEELLTRASEQDTILSEYFIQFLLSFFTFVTLVVALVASVLFQTCRNCLKVCRAVVSLILLTYCLFLMILSLIESIDTKYKVNLTDDQIYIFDDEFNDEIKEKVKLMFNRKIYMICFPIFLTLAVIAKYTLIIIDVKLSRAKINSSNNNQQVAIPIESEGGRKNENENIEIHIRQNIVTSQESIVKN